MRRYHYIILSFFSICFNTFSLIMETAASRPTATIDLNAFECSPCREAKTLFALFVEQFPSLMKTEDLLPRLRQSPPPPHVPFLCLMNHFTPSYSIYLIYRSLICFHLRLRLPSGSFPSDFPTKSGFLYNVW